MISKIIANDELIKYLKIDTTREEIAITIPVGYPKSMKFISERVIDDKKIIFA